MILNNYLLLIYLLTLFYVDAKTVKAIYYSNSTKIQNRPNQLVFIFIYLKVKNNEYKEATRSFTGKTTRLVDSNTIVKKKLF